MQHLGSWAQKVAGTLLVLCAAPYSAAQNPDYIHFPATFSWTQVWGLAEPNGRGSGLQSIEEARDAAIRVCETTLYTGVRPPHYLGYCEGIPKYSDYGGPAIWRYAIYGAWSPDGSAVIDSGRTAIECPKNTSLDLSSIEVRFYPPTCRKKRTGVDPDKNLPPKVCVGNPCDPGSGNKWQREVHYAGGGGTALQYVLNYHSIQSSDTGQGANWRSNFSRGLRSFNTPGYSYMLAHRGDGKVVRFYLQNTAWRSDADIGDRLLEQKDAAGLTVGWQYIVADDDTVEDYDTHGKLLAIRFRNGQAHTLTYSDASTPAAIAPKPGLLIGVTDSFGRQLTFTYDMSAHIIQMTDPAGGVYQYGYDNRSRLTSVKYPDNRIRTYLYNELVHTANTDLPTALTGILDENGARFATYRYDSQGRVVSTEHAGGVEKYTLSYTVDVYRDATITAAAVTDPLGVVRNYAFTTVLSVNHLHSFTQPAGNGSAAATKSMTYDANGNIATRTDFNGAQTTYVYDLARNLETRRTEAAGTPEARTISTEWHPSYRLPIRIAEPKRITAHSYDDRGNLLAKTVQATADASGSQGFDAAAVGAPRIWRYTYNAYGQVLTATGPRTEVDDTTVYTYDAQGNLATITNAAGQVTTLSQYDAHGRVGKITDPNGLVTELAYSPRGWLTAKTVGGEVTSYEYDGVGQLTKATPPDGAYVAYSYDDAHRLTAIADSLGNRIGYTLDAMGNRVKEEVQDPDGALSRKTTRVYDALNRLQQITGGGQ